MGALVGKADRYFEEHKPDADLGRASLHSGAVLVASRCVNVFVQLTSTVVLARLLDPHTFGLVALVTALTGLAPMLIELGTTDASIQKARVGHGEISTLFWLNIAIALVLTALFAGSSGFIASFFGEPALVGIALVSSISFIMTGLTIQHYALMRRVMEFRRIALIELSANVIASAIAVAMAFFGWSYWALVAKPVITAGMIAAGAWMSCAWLPGRPKVNQNVKEMVRFGLGITGFTVTDYISRSADRLALGYFYGPGPLGYFQNAAVLYSNVLGILTEPVHNVAISSLSKLRDNGDELRRSWAVALSTVSFVSASAFAVLAVTGQDFVVILLGQKWEPAGPLLCIFCVRGIPHSIERSLGWLHVVAGRSDNWMRWGVFSCCCQLMALMIGLPFGLIGVAISYTVVTFALFVPAVAYSGRPLGIDTKDVVAAVGPQTTAGLIAIVVGFVVQLMFLGQLSPLMRFCISAPLCLSIYLIVAVGVFKVIGPINLAASMLRDLNAAQPRIRQFLETSKHVRFLESMLVRFGDGPLSLALLGFCSLSLLGALWGESASILITFVFFICLMVALRSVAALLRRNLPFSEATREIWESRRETARDHQAYFWQKGLWIGLGMLPYAFMGNGLRNGALVLTLFCLVSGIVGQWFWRRAGCPGK